MSTRSEMTPAPEPPVERRDGAGSGTDALTAMTSRFGVPASAFARRFFSHFDLPPEEVLRLRGLEGRGAVVYVMRYGSRLDYFLFNWLFLAAGVRLSVFANGIRFYYYRPLREAVPLFFRGLMSRLRMGAGGVRDRALSQAREAVLDGHSMFLFLRTNQIRSRMQRRKGAVASGQRELDYLREVVETAFDKPVTVSLVPLAVFWRKGTRARRPFLNLFYGAPERPSDTYKVLSFLWSYRGLALRVGTAIDLRGFVDERREQGLPRVLKQVRRSLLIFLRREEKAVIGSALRTRAQIEEAILLDPEVRRCIEESAARAGRSVSRQEARALRHIREIAAHPSQTMLAILDVIVTWIFGRLFARVDVHGLERVVEEAKLRPLVVLPSHRSHFDYLILSWLFYERHLVPPLVGAGINLAFWPLGPIFRRAGAFFLRRSFDGDPLYSAVFRSYMEMLLKDGSTQEFFIEGTRSRTGKTLQPRTGMIKMILAAFQHGVRRDVSLVPVSFTYERLVEEGSMTRERRGSEKTKESLLELIRASRVLRSRFGAVSVRFGEPISLAAQPDLDPKRIADDVSRRLNALVTAGRSSVSAAALLGGPARGLRESEFADRVREICALLDLAGLARSEQLDERLREGQPEAAVDLLLQGGLVERLPRASGDLLCFSERSRDGLAYYRMTISPALVWPAVLALSIGASRGREAVIHEASEFLDLLRLEYFPPERAQCAARFSKLLDHMAERGWVSEGPMGELKATRSGRAWLDFLASQIAPILETYRALFAAVRDMADGTPRAKLLADAQDVLEDQLLLGEARHSESVCPTTLGNALQLLIEEGAVVTSGNPRSGDTTFERGPRPDVLERLPRRVAAGLGVS